MEFGDVVLTDGELLGVVPHDVLLSLLALILIISALKTLIPSP
jgi:hypothetical protein